VSRPLPAVRQPANRLEVHDPVLVELTVRITRDDDAFTRRQGLRSDAEALQHRGRAPFSRHEPIVVASDLQEGVRRPYLEVFDDAVDLHEPFPVVGGVGVMSSRRSNSGCRDRECAEQVLHAGKIEPASLPVCYLAPGC
jgi:hypothetical protein